MESHLVRLESGVLFRQIERETDGEILMALLIASRAPVNRYYGEDIHVQFATGAAPLKD